MSKGNSHLFSGTFGTSVSGLTQPLKSYSDRGIDIPENIRSMIEALPKKGAYIKGSSKDFSMRDVSIMSKETGVEFARITIENESYLIRGDQFGAMIPPKLIRLMRQKHSSFDYHSHPHDDDLVPSEADIKAFKKIRRITHQKSSSIITPNGRKSSFNQNGIISVGSIRQTVNDDYKRALAKLFGGEIT